MRKTVLLVDDDPTIAYTIEVILDRADIDLKHAVCGADALTILREGFRGLILMDVLMPRMDGWETIRAMVDEGLVEGNVICMLTAVVTPNAETMSLQDYVVDSICKPFRALDLTQKVIEYLDLVP